MSDQITEKETTQIDSTQQTTTTETEEDPAFDKETLRTMGTSEQTMIISNYPTQEIKDKLKVPHIEKQNGNLCIKVVLNDSFKNQDGTEDQQDKDIQQDQVNGHRVAIGYYNKSLLSLKMLFDDNNNLGCITDQKQAVGLIRDIEIPVCLNLTQCYIKTKQYHYGIKYATQVLDKNLPVEHFVSALEKAYYRRGKCYYAIGDIKNAKGDLNEARKLAESENRTNPEVLQQLNIIKQKEIANREKEKEIAKKMLGQTHEKEETKKEEVIVDDRKPLDGYNQILALIIDIFMIVYSTIYVNIAGLVSFILFIRLNFDYDKVMAVPPINYFVSRFDAKIVKRFLRSYVKYQDKKEDEKKKNE